MPGYANLGGNSNVDSYRLVYEGGESGIVVTFMDGSEYLYTETSVGSSNLQRMIDLAKQGVGLNSFINTRVKYRYAAKL